MESVFEMAARFSEPPVKFHNEMVNADDLFVHEQFFVELAERNSYVPLGIKRRILALWVNSEEFDDPDLMEYRIQEDAHDAVLKLAKLDPVVDLESLRGLSWRTGKYDLPAA